MSNPTVDDFSACVAAAREASETGTELSDGAARTIGALYAEGRPSQSFATTGSILPGLWQDLFGSLYANMPPEEQLLADMLGTYLTTRENSDLDPSAPVDGWSRCWVR